MAELRSEEEQLEVVKRWWKENGTSLIAGAVLAAAGVFGWNAWQTTKRVSQRQLLPDTSSSST